MEGCWRHQVFGKAHAVVCLVVVFGLQYDSIICISPLLLRTPAAGSVALTHDLNTANVKVGEDEGEGVGWFVVPPPPCSLVGAGT